MIDIKTVATEASARILDLLDEWLPGGKLKGAQYRIGSLQGDPGESLSIDVNSGRWFDHATGEKGGDMVALLAAIRGCSQLEAATEIAGGLPAMQATPVRKPPPEPEYDLVKPPADAGLPPGMPDHRYVYDDVDGSTVFIVDRWDAQGTQRKRIVPWSWDALSGEWVRKAFPNMRVLFGLRILAQRPGAPVCIVEGEKACLAARDLLPQYAVVTWQGGGQAFRRTDWSMLAGRNILLWPDADEAGETTMREIGEVIAGHGVGTAKQLNVADRPNKWDAADWEGDRAEFLKWAKPRVHEVQLAVPDDEHYVPETIIYEDRDAAPEPVVPAVKAAPAADDQYSLGLVVSSKGKIYANLQNACRIIERSEVVKGRAYFSEFAGRLMRREGAKARAWTDADTSGLTRWIQDNLGIPDMGSKTVLEALYTVHRRQPRHEVQEWIAETEWDGVDRIEMFLIDHLGVNDTPYARAVSRNFWLSMVARVYDAGCKVDTMLILEGPQGAMKSQALAGIVGGDWHMEATENVSNKDFYISMAGKLLIEIAELDSFGKAEATKVKQVITNRIDTYRSPYGMIAEDHPRRCVFAGSTNEDHYLKDSTGGRRFWPVKVGFIDMPGIRECRRQAFAEAAVRYHRGETWWDMPSDETRAEQEARRQADVWEESIAAWLRAQNIESCTIRQVAMGAIEMDLEKITRGDQARISQCLRSIGWGPADKPEWCGMMGKAVRKWRPINGS